MTYQPPPPPPGGTPPPPPPPPGQWGPPPSPAPQPGAPQPGGAYAPQPGAYASPPPPQGGYPPPAQGGYPAPGGGYGSPGGGASGGKPAFDPKAVNPMDWAIVGVAVLALIFSYIHYYAGDLGEGYTYTLGPGFVGFLAWLLGLVGAACAIAPYAMPHLKLPFPVRLIGTAAFALALILSLLKLLVRPSALSFTASIGFGLIIVTILYAIGTALSYMRFTQTGGSLSQVSNKSGGPGNQPPPGYGPPPGQ